MHWDFSFIDESVKETRPLSHWHFIHRKWPVSKRLRILLNASGSVAGWCQLLDTWPVLGFHTIAPNLQTENSVAETANFALKACPVLYKCGRTVLPPEEGTASACFFCSHTEAVQGGIYTIDYCASPKTSCRFSGISLKVHLTVWNFTV